jgi:hypothetical protein
MRQNRAIGLYAAPKYGGLATFVLALAATATFSPIHVSPRPAALVNDLEALQGTWVLKSTEWCGMSADQDPTDDPTLRRREIAARRLAEERELPTNERNCRTTLKITGSEFVLWNGVAATSQVGCFSSRELTSGTFTLDSTQRPPIMTRQIEQSQGGDENTKFLAIYWIQGNTLRLGIERSNDPEKLPASCVTDKDEDVVVLTFRRERR